MKPRSTHYLRRNHGSYSPINWCFLHTASHQIKEISSSGDIVARLAFGCAEFARIIKGRAMRGSRILFHRPEDFFSWLFPRCHQGTSVWIVGDGIAKHWTLCGGWDLLDAGVLSLTPPQKKHKHNDDGDLADAEDQHGLFVDGQSVTICKFYGPKFQLHLVDSKNYGGLSFEEIAEGVGDKVISTPALDATPKKWESWIESRVKTLRKHFVGLANWWRDNDYGVWRHTSASLSMAAFRHRFNKAKLLVHNCSEALKLEREALAGGQFLNFRIGYFYGEPLEHAEAYDRAKRNKLLIHQGDVYHLDVNSLYPAMMKAHQMPVELVAWKPKASLQDWESWSKTLLCIARVKVRTEENIYPFWHEGSRYWATGEFDTTLFGPELRRAAESGEIVSWDLIAAYYPGKPFASFVDHFWSERIKAREEKNYAADQFSKLILNSLFGKFGQMAQDWKESHYPDPPKRWGSFVQIDAANGQIRDYRAIGGFVQVKEARRESHESMPAIAAAITCYGRERMRLLRSIARAENLVYQGCDSLHVTRDGFQRLRDEVGFSSEDLGGLRFVGCYASAHYRGPSDYTTDFKHTISGIKKTAESEDEFSFSQFEDPSLRKIICRQPDGTIRIRKVKKIFGSYHPRGQVDRLGRVFPPKVVNGQLIQSLRWEL